MRCVEHYSRLHFRCAGIVPCATLRTLASSGMGEGIAIVTIVRGLVVQGNQSTHRLLLCQVLSTLVFDFVVSAAFGGTNNEYWEICGDVDVLRWGARVSHSASQRQGGNAGGLDMVNSRSAPLCMAGVSSVRVSGSAWAEPVWLPR
jgi:hypothetical protein